MLSEIHLPILFGYFKVISVPQLIEDFFFKACAIFPHLYQDRIFYPSVQFRFFTQPISPTAESNGFYSANIKKKTRKNCFLWILQSLNAQCYLGGWYFSFFRKNFVDFAWINNIQKSRKKTRVFSWIHPWFFNMSNSVSQMRLFENSNKIARISRQNREPSDWPLISLE